MGKRKRNQQSLCNTWGRQGLSDLPSPPNDKQADVQLYDLVLPDELEVTVDTLRTLAQNPDIIKSKACRELRTAVYDFRQACPTGLNSTSKDNLK